MLTLLLVFVITTAWAQGSVSYRAYNASINQFEDGVATSTTTVSEATTTNAVAVIAELSGFSRSSFFRIFSDAYGMSPSDYRKAARK